MGKFGFDISETDEQYENRKLRERLDAHLATFGAWRYAEQAHRGAVLIELARLATQMEATAPHHAVALQHGDAAEHLARRREFARVVRAAMDVLAAAAKDD